MPEPSPTNGVIFLRGGTIVNHDSSWKADILIEDGIIKDIGTELDVPTNAKVIDVTDRLLLPGGIDLDCSITEATQRNPVADGYLSASKAALLGGTTTVVTSLECDPETSLSESFDRFLSNSAQKFACDYGVCMKISHVNATLASDLKVLTENKGVSAFSIVLGSKPTLPDAPDCQHALTDEQFCFILQTCRQIGALVVVDAATSTSLSQKLARDLKTKYPDMGPEFFELASPEDAEADTILRTCLFSFQAGFTCPILISRIHSEAALECLSDQRRKCRGLLFGQTTISAIKASKLVDNIDPEIRPNVLTQSSDWASSAGCVSWPPVRASPQLGQRLITQLVTGDIVSVGSGHRAITTAVRAALGLTKCELIPDGIAALGYRLIALWNLAVEDDGGLDPCTFVKVTSADPARLINIYPQKGRIAVGSDADIVVWNTNRSQVGLDHLLPNGVHNLFADVAYRAGPEMVLLRGRVVVQNSALVEDASPAGQFVVSKPFGCYTYSRVQAIEHYLESNLKSISREPYTGAVFCLDSTTRSDDSSRESHFFRKEYYDNVPKVALPPGQRVIHTSVKTAQPPGGSSNAFWMQE